MKNREVATLVSLGIALVVGGSGCRGEGSFDPASIARAGADVIVIAEGRYDGAPYAVAGSASDFAGVEQFITEAAAGEGWTIARCCDTTHTIIVSNPNGDQCVKYEEVSGDSLLSIPALKRDFPDLAADESNRQYRTLLYANAYRCS